MSLRSTFFLLGIVSVSLLTACGSDSSTNGGQFPYGNAGASGESQAGSSGASGDSGNAGSSGAAGESGNAGTGGGGNAGAGGSSAGSSGAAGNGGSAGESGSAGSAGHPYDGDDVTPRHVRIIAANLSSGNKQSYTPGEGIRILSALQPDIILIQEMNYRANTKADIADLAAATLGAPAHYVREPSGAIPNGIISRYPIIESGSWAQPSVSDRGFAWARIDVPGPDDLWAVSVHLKANSSSSDTRNAQAQALVKILQPLVPPTDLIVVGGDFNTQSRGESCVSSFSQLLDTSGPYPSDAIFEGGNEHTNTNRNKPYDWVLTDSNLRAREVSVTLGDHEFPSGLVFDSRTYQPLSDLPGVLATDSGAPSMQHMPVIRDFYIGN